MIVRIIWCVVYTNVHAYVFTTLYCNFNLNIHYLMVHFIPRISLKCIEAPRFIPILCQLIRAHRNLNLTQMF